MEKILVEKGLILRTPVNAKAKEGPKSNSRCPRFLSNVYDEVQSRYLGTATGSCHDLCKYSHKYGSKDDQKSAAFTRLSINSDAIQTPVRGMIMSDEAKVLPLEKTAVSRLPSAFELNPTSLESNCFQVSPKDDAKHIKILNSGKKKCPVINPKDFPVLETTPIKHKKKAASYMKETVPSYLKLNSQNKSTASPRFQGGNKTVYLPTIKIDCYGIPAISLKEGIPTNLGRNPKSSRNLDRNQNSSRNLDRNQNSSRNLDRNRNCSRNLDRNLNSSKSLDGNLCGSKSLERNGSKSFKVPEIGCRSFLNLKKVSSYSSTASRSEASLKTRKFSTLEQATKGKEVKSNDITGKHEIIQARSQGRGVDVHKNKDAGSTSESFASDLTDLSETDHVKWKQSYKHLEEVDITLRRAKAVGRDDDSSLSYKMKFKRGKVIELVPTETIGPRKLRFRKTRMINPNSVGEGMKRIAKRRNVDDMKPPGAETQANSSEASAVMLKHQELCEKKDGQVLFNLVIEETASRLVEARKSKVKALVGAFETVILLQETKATQVS